MFDGGLHFPKIKVRPSFDRSLFWKKPWLGGRRSTFRVQCYGITKTQYDWLNGVILIDLHVGTPFDLVRAQTYFRNARLGIKWWLFLKSTALHTFHLISIHRNYLVKQKVGFRFLLVSQNANLNSCSSKGYLYVEQW